MSYVYQKSKFEPLWTVGFYDPDGKWMPESDLDSEKEAAERTAWLNGSRKYSQIDANFLVQTPDGVLHTYWDQTILRCDLRDRKHEDVKIYRLENGMLPKYRPVTRQEILE